MLYSSLYILVFLILLLFMLWRITHALRQQANQKIMPVTTARKAIVILSIATASLLTYLAWKIAEEENVKYILSPSIFLVFLITGLVSLIGIKPNKNH